MNGGVDLDAKYLSISIYKGSFLTLEPCLWVDRQEDGEK